MPLEKFLLGAFTTALREDEILESVGVPKLSRAGRYGYYKFCRKTGGYAEASAAAVFAPGSQIARIYFGAVRPAPISLSALATTHSSSPSTAPGPRAAKASAT